MSKANTEKMEWYILNTMVGHEKRAVSQIEQRLKAVGLEEYVEETLIPTQEKISAKAGKKVKKVERVLPGYVFIKMVLNDETWQLIRTTEAVTGFLGQEVGKKPRPTSQKEVDVIKKATSQSETVIKESFSVGNPVKVLDGPFKDKIGPITEIDAKKQQLTVLIPMFGRDVATPLDFTEVVNLSEID